MRILIRNSPTQRWESVPLDDAVRIAFSLYVNASGCTALTELRADAAEKLGIGVNPHALITDLLPWEEEMKLAKEAFESAQPQIGDWCKWLHHEIEFERLTEGWINRFNWVRYNKPETELAWRFRLMRPSSEEEVAGALQSLVKGGR